MGRTAGFRAAVAWAVESGWRVLSTTGPRREVDVALANSADLLDPMAGTVADEQPLFKGDALHRRRSTMTVYRHLPMKDDLVLVDQLGAVAPAPWFESQHHIAPCHAAGSGSSQPANFASPRRGSTNSRMAERSHFADRQLSHSGKRLTDGSRSCTPRSV